MQDSVAVQAVSLPSNGPLRLSPRAGGSFYALRRVVPQGYPRCCCQDCFPRIVYTPPRELTNFTSQPRVASLFRCCLTGAEILMNPTRKNSSCSFGRKFYIIVHFFLSTRRLSPLFFATEREKRSPFCDRQVRFAHPDRR